MTAPTEKGNIASMVSDSRGAPLVDLPCPRAMADSMEALERAPLFALVIAASSRAFRAGSGPPTISVQHHCCFVNLTETDRLTLRSQDDIPAQYGPRFALFRIIAAFVVFDLRPPVVAGSIGCGAAEGSPCYELPWLAQMDVGNSSVDRSCTHTTERRRLICDKMCPGLLISD